MMLSQCAPNYDLDKDNKSDNIAKMHDNGKGKIVAKGGGEDIMRSILQRRGMQMREIKD